MQCDLCKDADDGKGIHYHAFIDGKHFWVCEVCKVKYKVRDDQKDDVEMIGRDDAGQGRT